MTIASKPTVFTYFEPLSAGHCAHWAQLVLTAAAVDPRIRRLRLVTGAEMADRLADVCRSTGLECKILSSEVLAMMTTGGLLCRGRAQWGVARALLQQAGGILFLPFFDHAIYGAVLDRRPVRGRISGVVFRPPNDFGYIPTAKRRFDTARRWGSYIAARRPALGPLFTLDEGAAMRSGSRLRRLLYLPDPAPHPSLFARADLQPIFDRRRRYLLFGALTERKGILKVLDAVACLSPAECAAIGLRFVGRLDPAIADVFWQRLAALRRDIPNLDVEVEDRFVSDAELAQEIMACDVVLAPYQNHVGSSGVVLWAASAGKPLISQRAGAMGYQVYRYGLGATVDCTDECALAAALSIVPPPPRGAQLFAAQHAPAEFQRALLDGCLG